MILTGIFGKGSARGNRVLIPWRALNDSYTVRISYLRRRTIGLNTLTGIEWFLRMGYEVGIEGGLEVLIPWRALNDSYKPKMRSMYSSTICLNTLTGIEWFLLRCTLTWNTPANSLNTLTGIEWFLRKTEKCRGSSSRSVLIPWRALNDSYPIGREKESRMNIGS